MTYIQPNSTVELYSNMPLDPQYNDTLYFATRDDQTAFFNTTAHKVQTLNYLSYVRKGTNTIRFTPNGWGSALSCNYLRFKNTSFENQWFYAFIVSCEYINNSTAQITFTIDVMQTWFFGRNSQLNIKPSFVLRQHSRSDVIGNNIEPEPIELNEYMGSGTIAQLGANQIGFIVAIVDTNQQTQGGISGGVYSGATLYYYETASGIDSKINDYLQHPESVLAVYAVPKIDGATDGTNVTNISAIQEDTTITGVTPTDDIDGYYPKNKKCYTYPYNFLRAYTYEGNYADFRYEYFRSAPQFTSYSCVVQPVKSVLVPRNYKASHGTSVINPTEGLNISSYPVCSWNSDTYASWVAQNSVPMNNMTRAQEEKIRLNNVETGANAALSAVNGIANVAMDAVLAPITGGMSAVAGARTGISTATGIGSSVIGNMIGNQKSNIDFNTSMQNAKYSASVQADTIHGTIGSGNTMIAMGRPGFYAVRMYQPAQVIQKVDDYFTLYGYAVNRIQIPNLNARPHWTYARISDIQLTNQLMPADALGQVKQIFENGIRFWKDVNEIGNYNLDNSPS